MTKRDFFIIIIKFFGLHSLIISIFYFLPNNVSFALTIVEFDILTIIWTLVSIIVSIGLFIILIFYADKIVNILRLDQKFDDDKIEIGNLKLENVLILASILIGGFLIIDNISSFLSHSIFAFKKSAIGIEFSDKEKIKLAISGLNILIGFLLITNYNSIAKLLKIKK